jgi:glucan biosynthesis protein C
MSLTIFRDQECCDDRTAAAVRPEAARALGPDLVRGLAAILVVYLHAAVVYLSHPMPGLVWATEDTPSDLVSHLFWSIELFIMPLFLILAGFFAYRSWISSGDLGLIRSRARRWLVPLAVASAILLPIDYLVWLVGWVIDGKLSASQLWPPKFPRDMREHLFGFAHLWFLLYVFLYCVVLAGWGNLRRRWLSQLPRTTTDIGTATSVYADEPVERGAPQLFLFACGLPLVGAGVLLWTPEVVFGFQHAFLPVASKWLYSGTFFFGGVVVAACDPRMRLAIVSTPRLAGTGVVCGWAAVLLGQWAIERADATSLAMDMGFVARITLAILTVVSAWTLSLAIIGLGNLASPWLLQHPRARHAVSYLAASSFWIYLVHHPLVAILQINLKITLPNVSPLAKSLVVTAGSVAIAIASYELLIRGRALGRLLGLEMAAKRSLQANPEAGQAEVASEPASVKSRQAVPSPPAVRRAA